MLDRLKRIHIHGSTKNINVDNRSLGKSKLLRSDRSLTNRAPVQWTGALFVAKSGMGSTA